MKLLGLLFPFIILLATGLFFYYLLSNLNKRPEDQGPSLERKARSLGLGYQKKDSLILPFACGYLNFLNQGENKVATNIMKGHFQGHEILLFDHSYTQGSLVDRYHISAALLRLPKSFPQLLVEPETLLHKLGEGIGLEDIDLDNLEFSRRYRVRSRSEHLQTMSSSPGSWNSFSKRML